MNILQRCSGAGTERDEIGQQQFWMQQQDFLQKSFCGICLIHRQAIWGYGTNQFRYGAFFVSYRTKSSTFESTPRSLLVYLSCLRIVQLQIGTASPSIFACLLA